MNPTQKITELTDSFCAKQFDFHTASLSERDREGLLRVIEYAMSMAGVSGFARGLDKGRDIWQGSPKVAAAYPLEEVPAPQTKDDFEEDMRTLPVSPYLLVSQGEGCLIAESARLDANDRSSFGLAIAAHHASDYHSRASF